MGTDHQAAEPLQLQILQVLAGHVRQFAKLPAVHADRFDRMLVAQAMAEDLVILAADERIQQYPVRTLR